MSTLQRAQCSWGRRRTAALASCGTTKGLRSPRSGWNSRIDCACRLLWYPMLPSAMPSAATLDSVTLCCLQVAAFQAAASPVTIGEFHGFAVTARGYECPEFWEPEDHALFAGRGQVTALAMLQHSCADRVMIMHRGTEVSRQLGNRGQHAVRHASCILLF